VRHVFDVTVVRTNDTGAAACRGTATPIGRSDSVAHYNASGFQDGGVFLSTSTNGGVTPQSAFVQATAQGFDTGNAFLGVVEADAAITFRPLIDNVVVRAAPAAGAPGLAKLYDDTAGATVLAFQAFQGVFTPAAYDVSLDLTHLYTIYVSANGNNLMQGARLSIVPAPGASVPEADSTLTFFVVGLGALLLVARSPKFRASRM
jgi:hypothetical protein